MFRYIYHVLYIKNSVVVVIGFSASQITAATAQAI